MKNWHSKYKQGILFFLLTILIIVLWIFIPRFFQSPPNEFQRVVKEAPKHIANAEKKTIPLYAEAAGNIMPRLSSTLSSEISAKVMQVFATAGDFVYEGQVLAKLDEEQYALEAERAQNELIGLKAMLTEAGLHYQRTKRLLQKEASTEVEYEKAKANFENVKSKVQAAIKNRQRLQNRLEKTVVKSPYQGRIGEKFIEEGDFVMPGTPLFITYVDEPFEIHAKVPSKLLPFLTIGGRVSVEAGAFHLRTSATVTQIIPFGDPQAHTFLVKAHLDHQGSALPKAFGKMTFPIGYQKAVLIPESFVQKIGQLELIDVCHQNTWQTRYIKTGERFDGKVIVLSGIKEGDTIGHD